MFSNMSEACCVLFNESKNIWNRPHNGITEFVLPLVLVLNLCHNNGLKVCVRIDGVRIVLKL
jgi:hypothetical protein